MKLVRKSAHSHLFEHEQYLRNAIHLHNLHNIIQHLAKQTFVY